MEGTVFCIFLLIFGCSALIVNEEEYMEIIKINEWERKTEAEFMSRQDLRKESADLAFASYYGDHMVLQCAPKMAVIWGYSSEVYKGKEVIVTVESDKPGYKKQYPTLVRFDTHMGKYVWKVKLYVVKEGGPYTITASLVGTKITAVLKDVMFGDVWVCAGQSNMSFPVAATYNATQEEEAAGNFTNIRLFNTPQNISPTPLFDLAKAPKAWAIPSKNTVRYFSAVCWLYGRHIYQQLQRPIGLVLSQWGGTPIEAWSSPDAIKMCPNKTLHKQNKDGYNIPSSGKLINLENGVKIPHAPTVLWNAMIHPYLNMTVYGAIWYQGEQNAGVNPETYNCTFPAMISDWRQKFHEGSFIGGTDTDFPFGFVQLGPRKTPDNLPGLAEVRWHQTADIGYAPNIKLYNVFMAVAMDLFDLKGGIHYRDKGTVGKRLSLAGLDVAYSIPQKYQGPFPTSVYRCAKNKTSKVKIIYDYGYTPIEVRSKTGFDICCTTKVSNSCAQFSKNWVAAPIVASDTASVTVTTAPCGDLPLAAIRYVWHTSPCAYKKCPVYSKQGELPAPPFKFEGFIDGDNLVQSC